VFTLANFADFPPYFSRLFSTLLDGTSRTDLWKTRLRTICLRGGAATWVSPEAVVPVSQDPVDATILYAIHIRNMSFGVCE
jgi:hypothetical protein